MPTRARSTAHRKCFLHSSRMSARSMCERRALGAPPRRIPIQHGRFKVKAERRPTDRSVRPRRRRRREQTGPSTGPTRRAQAPYPVTVATESGGRGGCGGGAGGGATRGWPPRRARRARRAPCLQQHGPDGGVEVHVGLGGDDGLEQLVARLRGPGRL